MSVANSRIQTLHFESECEKPLVDSQELIAHLAHFVQDFIWQTGSFCWSYDFPFRVRRARFNFVWRPSPIVIVIVIVIVIDSGIYSYGEATATALQPTRRYGLDWQRKWRVFQSKKERNKEIPFPLCCSTLYYNIHCGKIWTDGKRSEKALKWVTQQKTAWQIWDLQTMYCFSQHH